MRIELTKAEASHILEALRSCDTELEQLELAKEWYSTTVTDHIASARQILEEKLNEQSR